jgi:hypothetical protein
MNEAYLLQRMHTRFDKGCSGHVEIYFSGMHAIFMAWCVPVLIAAAAVALAKKQICSPFQSRADSRASQRA